MDLSTVEERLDGDFYTAPKELVGDLELIFSNCRKYNDATTVYTKCAVQLEKYMRRLIREIPEWHELHDE
jgi:histone acetyltransferase